MKSLRSSCLVEKEREKRWNKKTTPLPQRDKIPLIASLYRLFLCFSSMSFEFFLDAFSHLYKRVCPSVRPSVRPSVGPSVRRSVTHELKPCKSAVFDQNYCQYQRERILWPCIRPCFYSFRKKTSCVSWYLTRKLILLMI